MNYSKLSDAEINKSIINKIYPQAEGLQKGSGESIWFSIGGFYENKDYCNNPSDAWTIISENNISIILDNPTMPCATANARDLFDDEDPIVSVVYDNPLRAAMIVYLMMQEAK